MEPVRVCAGPESCRLEFDLGSGTFSISSGDVEVFHDAVGRIVTRAKKGFEAHYTTGSWEKSETAEEALRLERRTDWGRMLFRAREREGALVLELGLLWEKEVRPPPVESVAPLVVPAGGIWPGRVSVKAWRTYVNGFQCWTPSGTVMSSRPGDYLFPLFVPRSLKPMLANSATPVFSEKGRFSSEWFAALGDIEREDSVVVGFTGVSRALSQVVMRLGRKPERAEMEAAARFEGKRYARGEEFWGEPLAVIPGDLSGANLERYADLVALEQGVGKPAPSRTGWCSWYQYFRRVTAEDVDRNLELLSGDLEHLGIEVVQLDDGYEHEVGDWLETGGGFGAGLGETADRIKSKGKVPGIWVAPFAVTRGSRIFKEEKDWLTKRKRRLALAGINPDWRRRFYGLDLSNPEVLEHLRHVFETLAGLGFRFFKLDHMGSGLLEGRPHDPSLTRAEAARTALAVIREAVGEESTVMAAGGPLMLGAGIVDIQRTGPDAAPAWRTPLQRFLRDRATHGLANCLTAMFTRCFMNGRLFEADPDCLMLRTSDTKLTRDEIKTHASGVSVFGGALMVSDDLGLWDEKQEELALRLLPRVPARPRCPDLWRRDIPGLMLSELSDPEGSYLLLWAVNWADAERDLAVDLGGLGLEPAPYRAFEFWTGRYLGESDRAFSLGRIPPHGSAVVRLTPSGDVPRLVGSTIHISQGAAELERFEPGERSMSIGLKSIGALVARVALFIPGAAQVKASSSHGEVTVEHLGGSIYAMKFELDREALLELDW